MADSISYVMIVVSDMKRSVKFYRDVLGLTLRFESPDWTEFETGHTTLALHGGGKSRHVTSEKGGRDNLAGTCSIGFNVEDLDKSYTELRSKGANFVMSPTLRESEGIKLAVCCDPDGLNISFAQNVPRNQPQIASTMSH